MRLLSVSALFTLFASAVSAQPPAPVRQAPVRWEYAELSYRAVTGRPGGKDADGNEVPAPKSLSAVKWTTGADEISVAGWVELAEQLKSPIRKGSTAAGERIQVLNALGAAGWELVETQTTNPPGAGVLAGGFEFPGGGGFGQPKGGFAQLGGPAGRAGGGTMLFKRRVP